MLTPRLFKIAVFLSGVFLILDRLLKFLLQIKEIKITLIPVLLNLEFYPNQQGPFSLPIPNLITIFASALLIIIFSILAYLKPNLRSSLLIVLVGAISNLFDRIFYGYTLDTFNFLNFSFFNLADVLITVGIMIIALQVLSKRIK